MELILTNGTITHVDASDFQILSRYSWYLFRGRGTNYVAAKIGNKTVMLHRMILGLTGSEKTDHIDGDGLNNRRENLRACTHSQNMRNRVHRKRTAPKGVYELGSKLKPYRASISINGRAKHLGNFATESEAKSVYAKAAIELFGEFAHVN